MQTTDIPLKTYQASALFDQKLFEDRLAQASQSALSAFKQITGQYALFHILFFAIGIVELFAFVLFFSFLTKSAFFAFTIAGLFFTGFAYFVLLFYFQAKKPQQLQELRNTFVQECKTALPFEPKAYEYHIAQIHALYCLLSQFHRQEYGYYGWAERFKTLSILTQKFSVWTHWKDVHQIKEKILLTIIKEYTQLVQIKPTDLEIHAGLANAFVTLSKVYMDPQKTDPEEEHLWISPDYHSQEMHEKFQDAALKAVEEFRILDAYAPHDPWIHSQLASIYRDLGMADKEIKEYEAIIALSPKDQDILLRLGILYFTAGQNAQALHLYEKLKVLNSAKAQELLSYYGAAFFNEEEFS